jgi:hypothetical protein
MQKKLCGKLKASKYFAGDAFFMPINERRKLQNILPHREKQNNIIQP